jgi:hypothetical protein
MATREVHEHFIKCVTQWENMAALADMYPKDDARVVEAKAVLDSLLDRFELKDPPP